MTPFGSSTITSCATGKSLLALRVPSYCSSFTLTDETRDHARKLLWPFEGRQMCGS